jgi:D-3-phosphoglycerate dehydrogenase
MPKVLVADKISPTGVALLKAQAGYEVVEAYGSSPEKVLELVKDVQAILVRSETQITREVLNAAKKLICVGRAGVGVDNIDVDAATERGVIVMNTPLVTQLPQPSLPSHTSCHSHVQYPKQFNRCAKVNGIAKLFLAQNYLAKT